MSALSKTGRWFIASVSILALSGFWALAASRASAISMVGATSANNSIATTLTLAVPSGVSAGDVLVASLDVEHAPSITMPSGWSLIRSDTNPAALNLRQASYYHVAGSSEPSSYTWTFSAAHGASGGIIDYSGVDNNNPIDASGGQTGNSSTALVAPSINTNQPNDMLIAVFGDGVNRTYTTPAGMALRFNNSTTVSGEKTDILGFDQQLTTAGVTGSRSISPNGTSVYVGQLIALKSAPAVNQPPVVDSVSINQRAPQTNDILSASIQAHDPDGDSITYTYQWILNGADITGANSPTLDLSQSGNGNKGDTVQLRVVADDGTSQSMPATSSPVTIVDSAPSATVSLDNHTPDINSTVTATATDNDADGDQVLNSFVWKLNGTIIGGLDTIGNQSLINLSTVENVHYGDTLIVELTPKDGTANGAMVSDSATVTNPTNTNSPPVIDSVTVTPTSPFTNDILTANPTAHDLDGDTIAYTYQWLKNGVQISGQSAKTLDLSQSGNGNKNDQISVSVIASDGQIDSNSYTSQPVTIQNSPPIVNSVTLAPANPTVSDTLTATASAADADNDQMSYTYVWYLNGTAVKTDNTSSTTDSINVGNYASAGDSVYVNVSASDGSANGSKSSQTATVTSPSTYGQIIEYPTGGTAAPSNIYAGADGNLWFTLEAGTTSKNNIGRITPGGKVTLFPIPSLGNEGGITLGRDGNMWFAESNAYKIGRITPTGVITEFPLGGSLSVGGLVTGSDGNLWLTATSNNKILRMNMSGVVTGTFTIPTASSSPHGPSLGSDGNVWFAEVNGNKIGKITPAGVITEYKVPTAGASPVVTARGSDGNTWFTESGTNRVGRVTPTGTFKEYVLPQSGSQPFGIFAGPDGNLWFTEKAVNKIGMITTTGSITQFNIPSANSSPDKITAGPDGNMWFAEHNVPQVGVISLH